MSILAWRQAIGELRDAGFESGIVPELRSRIDGREPEIALPFSTKFGTETVNGTVHLHKTDGLDNYGIAAFIIQLRKAGHMEWLQQTFQQAGGPYSLREAYNLLSGRPIYKRFQDNPPTEAWLKLDFSRKLENGNFARKYYHHPEHAFDLRAVLNRYPIKELQNPGERTALIEGLYRGDLYPATFADINGTEKKFFITPNLGTKLLNVQDENGIRLSLERLVSDYAYPRVQAVKVKQVEERPGFRRPNRHRLE